MRGNFLYVPTDCPQRDERLGWTGDIQVFAPTASFLYDVRGFLDSWLRDLALEQEHADGVVPVRRAERARRRPRPAAAWGDAATVVPWVLYERYGDVAIARAAVPEHEGVGRRAARASPGDRRLWEGRFQFGDWLDPDAPPDQPGRREDRRATSSRAPTSSAPPTPSRARRALLGERRRTPRATRRSPRRCARRSSREYVTAAGPHGLGRPDRVRDGDRVRHRAEPTAARRSAPGWPSSTRAVGLPDRHRLRRHADHRRTRSPAPATSTPPRRLLMQTENPSWLYPVTMGATTIWERWDSMLPDGTINPGEMTSFNHYALGAIGDWLHRVVAGLAPDAPGLRADPHRAASARRASTSPRPSTSRPTARARAGVDARGRPHPGRGRRPAEHDGDGRAARRRATHEVGSGAHEWEVADAAPARVAAGAASDSTPASRPSSTTPRPTGSIARRARGGQARGGRSAFRTNTQWMPGRELGEAIFQQTGPELQQRGRRPPGGAVGEPLGRR